MVRFGNDPCRVHERVALWPLVAPTSGGDARSFTVLTPDGDVYEEDVADYDGCCLLTGGAEGHRAAEFAREFVVNCEVVRFAEPVEGDELLREIEAARRGAGAIIGEQPAARAASRYLDWGGAEHDLPGVGGRGWLAAAVGRQMPRERPARRAGALADHRVPERGSLLRSDFVIKRWADIVVRILLTRGDASRMPKPIALVPDAGAPGEIW